MFSWKNRRKIKLQKEINNQHESPKSLEATVNKVMQCITYENYPVSQEPVSDSTDEDDLMRLFHQFSGFMHPVSDWLELDTIIVISKTALEGKSTIYHVTIQNLTTALLDTGANRYQSSWKKNFKSLPQKPKLSKLENKAMSASGTTVIGTLHPIEIKDTEVTNISWTKTENSNTKYNPAKLPAMPPELSFQPEQNNLKQWIILQDVQIPQEARDKLSSLFEKDFNSITNLFHMDILTTGLPIAHKPYPISRKYQKLIDEEIRLLEDAVCISKSLSPWAASVIIVTKKPDPVFV